MSNNAVTEVLQLLVSAKVDALACLSPLVDGGFRSRAAVLGMTLEQACAILPLAHARKLHKFAQAQQCASSSSSANEKKKKMKKRERESQPDPQVDPPKRTREESARGKSVVVNRSPVMVLWAAVLAAKMGFDWPASLSLSSMVAGMNAKAKGQSLGIFDPAKVKSEMDWKGLQDDGWEQVEISLLGREIVAMKRRKEKQVKAAKMEEKEDVGWEFRGHLDGRIVEPKYVAQTLNRAFGQDLDDVYSCMKSLVDSLPEEKLLQQGTGYELYCAMRPRVACGRAGWGAKGRLELSTILDLKYQPPTNAVEVTGEIKEESVQSFEEWKGKILDLIQSSGRIKQDKVVFANLSPETLTHCISLLQEDGEVFMDKDGFLCPL